MTERCKEEDCIDCKEKCYEYSIGMSKRYTKKGIVDEYDMKVEDSYEL